MGEFNKGTRPSNPQKAAKSHGRKPPAPQPHRNRQGGYGASKKANQSKSGDSCCYAGQAVKAVWLGKFRLARRFARLDVKTRLGIL